MTQQPNTVKFIAPNGARVIVNDWRGALKKFDKGVMMQVIFNDPIIANN